MMHSLRGRPRKGMVRGNVVRALGKTIEEYRAIPFAEPPVGRLRFRPPLPKGPWEGTVDATSWKHSLSSGGGERTCIFQTLQRHQEL
ncbi:hypothetical protein HPB49_017882 [Dermacentor silvarum]|uniref:Uncharacterized protein n=1 Tax=Dermacentor silvarum TaxID=543639 RepID=A0ACB8C4Q0_DERSI|nr:hypothetical protein HPB49_017882 [Dermacentor silvarum]